jgi:hypothetical protein
MQRGGANGPTGEAGAMSAAPLSAAVARSVPLQSREGGSDVPCDVPLAWRVARVDDGFGLTTAQARAAVQSAADLWEAALDRPLFVNDPQDGFPIRFIFDERQARTQDRLAREHELRLSGERLDRAVLALRERDARRARAQAEYGERLRDHVHRADEHNQTVRRWTERGGAPRAVIEGLNAMGAELEEERAALESSRDELEAELVALREDERRVEQMFEEREREIDAVEAAFPVTPVEAGLYREAVRREDGRLISVSREIRLYRFDDEEDLRLVAAHELGHALGLGHRDEEGAVMNEEYRDTEGTAVRPGEAGRLGALCERAAGGGR